MQQPADEPPAKLSAERVRAYFEDEEVVGYYRRATANIGLWASEERLLCRLFSPADRLLDVGTGTGRIAIGLAELGYVHVLGIEVSRGMVMEARRIARILGLPVAFRQGDATRLKFDDNLFDGAIFGFNGLMQIPGRDARRSALAEIRRVLRPGAAFVFTTHDRAEPRYAAFWQEEQARWLAGRQKPQLLEFGDRWEETELGLSFMHVPTRDEVLQDLQSTGWTPEWDAARTEIASESAAVREFSDECRFWIARKPA